MKLLNKNKSEDLSKLINSLVLNNNQVFLKNINQVLFTYEIIDLNNKQLAETLKFEKNSHLNQVVISVMEDTNIYRLDCFKNLVDDNGFANMIALNATMDYTEFLRYGQESITNNGKVVLTDYLIANILLHYNFIKDTDEFEKRSKKSRLETLEFLLLEPSIAELQNKLYPFFTIDGENTKYTEITNAKDIPVKLLVDSLPYRKQIKKVIKKLDNSFGIFKGFERFMLDTLQEHTFTINDYSIILNQLQNEESVISLFNLYNMNLLKETKSLSVKTIHELNKTILSDIFFDSDKNINQSNNEIIVTQMTKALFGKGDIPVV